VIVLSVTCFSKVIVLSVTCFSKVIVLSVTCFCVTCFCRPVCHLFFCFFTCHLFFHLFLLSVLAVVVGQTAPHTTTHRDCCGLKDGSVDSLALLTLGVE
jgi:hypothetical protein